MKTTKCLQCSSSRLYARDLCKPCYLASWHLINSRQTTWTKLVRAGLAARSNRQLFRRRLTKLQRIINRVAKA
jgi:hypothetical protein